MSDTAAIDGVTGPGRRATLVLGEVQEVNLKLKKKVIEVVGRDGNMGQYDLAEVQSIAMTSDGTDLTLAVTSKGDSDVKRAEDDARSTIGGSTDPIREKERSDYATNKPRATNPIAGGKP